MQRSNIDWLIQKDGKQGYTWNPVTGCLHGCPYCYAERIAKRFAQKEYKCGNCNQAPGCDGETGGKCPDDFYYDKYERKHELAMPKRTFYPKKKIEPYPYGFEPTLHQYKLDEPKKIKKPSKIFVCSMADLFGEWVPDKWINQVLETVKQCPQHEFIFLTKNPKRYLSIEFPENAILGASVTDIKSYVEVKREMQHIKAKVKFLSIEPLFEPVYVIIENEGIPQGIDWVIIGAETGAGAKKINPEWVNTIMAECRLKNVPVFLKDSLNWSEKIQEFPANIKI